MKNKLIRKIDSQGRIVIPYFLIEICKLNKGDVIAFVSVGDDMISFIPYEQAKNLPVIYKVRLGEKNRIIIPQEFREKQNEVEFFIYKGFITIK